MHLAECRVAAGSVHSPLMRLMAFVHIPLYALYIGVRPMGCVGLNQS